MDMSGGGGLNTGEMMSYEMEFMDMAKTKEKTMGGLEFEPVFLLDLGLDLVLVLALFLGFAFDRGFACLILGIE